ncbi:5670_t:CDS:2 [Diversispora eburnea]|uniref:5670_t:CDS:1 n=1 Tax=Diversispora eburnea TaxID=1213867 RepID=A0A9N8YJF8_9GLOM|nr:5670_t:CDS:2 [Diversispora eburnea]
MSDMESENIWNIGNIENIFEDPKDIENTKNIENITKKSKNQTTNNFSSTKKSKKKTNDNFSSKKKTNDSFSSIDDNYSYYNNSNLSEIVKQFREADKIDDEKVKTKEIEQEIEKNMIPEISAHPAAIYTSRIFKLSEFSNSTNNSFFSKKNYEVTSREINYDAFILPSGI